MALRNALGFDLFEMALIQLRLSVREDSETVSMEEICLEDRKKALQK